MQIQVTMVINNRLNVITGKKYMVIVKKKYMVIILKKPTKIGSGDSSKAVFTLLCRNSDPT